MGFEIDEYLVGKLFKHLKKNKKIDFKIIDRTVFLNDIKPRLTILARALSGKPIEIFPAEREGGYKNNNYFLPISFAAFSTIEENNNFYLFRILYLSIQQRLDLNWDSTEKEPSLLLSQQKAEETSNRILAVIFEEFPVMEAFFFNSKQHFDEKSDAKKPTDYFPSIIL